MKIKMRVRGVKREDVMRIRKTFESSKRRYGVLKIKKKLEYRGIIIGLSNKLNQDFKSKKKFR